MAKVHGISLPSLRCHIVSFLKYSVGQSNHSDLKGNGKVLEKHVGGVLWTFFW